MLQSSCVLISWATHLGIACAICDILESMLRLRWQTIAHRGRGLTSPNRCRRALRSDLKRLAAIIMKYGACYN
jgi:hypothetical protein